MPDTTVDSVTFEVIRHKLWAIGDEQEITLKAVSGSPIVTESCDFNNGIYTASGEIVMLGRQILMHAGTMSQVLKQVVHECAADPGIEDGDMFLCNDPARGALHLMDIYCVAPIFYLGELVAWFGTTTHQVDVGGMEPGSWCPRATERIQEGLTIPPVKLVEKGKIRNDVAQLITSNSRQPDLFGLDIRAMIAANNVAKRRFLAIIEQYGLGTVKAVMEELLRFSERKLRQRLGALPNGVYRATDFLDHDGFENKLYKFVLSLKKAEDSLTFDFSGSSRQAPSFINCTESALIGSVLAGLMPILAYDIPWNEGLSKPVRIIAPPGIICNAQPPAPVSSATIAAGWVVLNVTISALSRLVGCSDLYRKEAQGVTAGSLDALNLRGRNQYGEIFGTLVMDCTGGGGAFSFRDGIAMRKGFSIPVPNIANVESNESVYPYLYLYRRIIRDSGGPGEFRGGRAGGLALTPHDTDSLDAVLITHGVEVPNSSGVFGGFPGSCCVNTLVKGSNIREIWQKGRLPDPGELDGLRMDLGAKPGRFSIGSTDVIEYTWQGGGGYGDCLARDPESVLRDVINQEVSVEAARQVYGVHIDPQTMRVDTRETDNLRNALRSQRLRLARVKADPRKTRGEAKRILRIGNYQELVEIDGQKIIRCRCGHEFGPVTENWKNGAAQTAVPANTAGPLVKLHQDLEMREYLCPACGLLHGVEVALKTEPPLRDIELNV